MVKSKNDSLMDKLLIKDTFQPNVQKSMQRFEKLFNKKGVSRIRNYGYHRTINPESPTTPPIKNANSPRDSKN